MTLRLHDVVGEQCFPKITEKKRAELIAECEKPATSSPQCIHLFDDNGICTNCGDDKDYYCAPLEPQGDDAKGTK